MAGRRGTLVIVVLVLAWGSTFAAVKVGVAGAPPVLFAGLRSLIGGAVMAVPAALRHGGPRARGNAAGYALLTVLNVVGFFGLQTLAIQELPSGLAAVLIYLQPVITGVLAAPLLGERLGANKVAGLLLAFGGIVLVSVGAIGGHVSGLGVGYAVGSALLWSLGTIAFKYTQGRVDPWWAVALPFLVGGAVLTIVGLATEGDQVDWSGPFVAALGYAALVGTALAWALWFALVGSGEASRAATYIFFVPLVSLVIGAVFLDEQIGVSLLAGSVLVVSGVSLVNRPRRPTSATPGRAGRANVSNCPVHIERIAPADLDLDTADAMAEISRASQTADGVDVTTPSGPARLKMYQHSSDGTPFAGVWLAREDDRLLGYASAFFPRRENTDAVHLSGAVALDARRQGVGRALLEAVLAHAADDRRAKVYSGAMAGGGSQAAMEALGFAQVHTYGINRLDVHDAPRERWQRLYDEAAPAAADYELVRLVGPTPDDRVEDVVALFAAINDAPMTDPEADPDAWSADRVRAYDEAMAARRQTVYRVLARHRPTGAWAGHTVLCVDEFDPSVGHQEDTSVVGAHRGHRLGVLLKADMLRWIAEERPEMSATETWNSVENHHMLAVNELLGTRTVARYASMRRA